jgi:hypothetical protein
MKKLLIAFVEGFQNGWFAFWHPVAAISALVSSPVPEKKSIVLHHITRKAFHMLEETIWRVHAKPTGEADANGSMVWGLPNEYLDWLHLIEETVR